MTTMTLNENKREICFRCKQEDHITFDCPNKPIMLCAGSESIATYNDKLAMRSKYYEDMRNRSEIDAEFDMHYGFIVGNHEKKNRTENKKLVLPKEGKNSSFDTKSTTTSSSSSSSSNSPPPPGTVDDIDAELGEKVNIETKNLVVTKPADQNLILSLERTLFAALNNAWLLAMGGAGLMSVGHNDPTPLIGGIVLVVMAIFVVTSALSIHASRVYRIKTGRSFQYSQSLLWVAFIGIATLVTMAFTLYYGIVYPFLQRTATVEVANIDFIEGGSL